MSIKDMPMFTNGVCVKYFKNRSYGFVHAYDQPGTDTFFHIKNVVSGNIEVGSRVKFEVVDTVRGTQAINISVEVLS